MTTTDKLIEAQTEAVRAMEDGRRILTSVAGSRVLRRFNAVPNGIRHLASAIADPAKFWGMAAAGSLGGQEDSPELAAAAIRAAAARLKVGDFGPIREALVGQAAWLGATAVRLMALTAEIEGGPRADERRAELVKLALRASDQAAKVLASAAALNAISGAVGVTVVGDDD